MTLTRPSFLLSPRQARTVSASGLVCRRRQQRPTHARDRHALCLLLSSAATLPPWRRRRRRRQGRLGRRCVPRSRRLHCPPLAQRHFGEPCPLPVPAATCRPSVCRLGFLNASTPDPSRPVPRIRTAVPRRRRRWGEKRLGRRGGAPERRPPAEWNGQRGGLGGNFRSIANVQVAQIGRVDTKAGRLCVPRRGGGEDCRGGGRCRSSCRCMPLPRTPAGRPLRLRGQTRSRRWRRSPAATTAVGRGVTTASRTATRGADPGLFEELLKVGHLRAEWRVNRTAHGSVIVATAAATAADTAAAAAAHPSRQRREERVEKRRGWAAADAVTSPRPWTVGGRRRRYGGEVRCRQCPGDRPRRQWPQRWRSGRPDAPPTGRKALPLGAARQAMWQRRGWLGRRRRHHGTFTAPASGLAFPRGVLHINRRARGGGQQREARCRRRHRHHVCSN
ncbi:hypothetical protein BU14_1384s0001 [Porphyra umbilicalis]|uniref:Uncharacterized protein n=1 Tax=Porphyra umbilicalis TaxID=2786 RepID=A0A1X6NLY1_PORUM|nr:hypothetical protein BU14_1384s0001 [Porphyra umbilicalis]|eukprot:OSX69572.1 hypothetical protein BU14_1384s0001 [Porphyra umbilicalis]